MKQILIPQQSIERKILVIRGAKVMLDRDLAELYGVPTKRLNEAVKRNRERFPDDFMFRLTERERNEVVANCDHLRALKFSAQLPYAFTEHGALMAASVLNSQRAVEVSVYVVRAFVKLKEMLLVHREIAKKLAELEKKVVSHDKDIHSIFEAIRKLMPSPATEKKRIGFTPHFPESALHSRGGKLRRSAGFRA